MEKIVIGDKQNCAYRKTCYGIVLKNNKILTVFSEKDNDYSLVGGGIEPGETPKQALKREFLEESGYKIIDFCEFINVDCFWMKKNGTKMETDALFYLVKVDEKNNINPTENFHKPVWIELSTILQDIRFPYQIKALELFMSNLSAIDFFA